MPNATSFRAEGLHASVNSQLGLRHDKQTRIACVDGFLSHILLNGPLLSVAFPISHTILVDDATN